MATQLSRLKANLMTSGLQKNDLPLFQVIKQLIEFLETTENNLTQATETIPEDVSGLDILTSSDESIQLPSSRELLAGDHVSFDDSVPNERTIDLESASDNILIGRGNGSGGGILEEITLGSGLVMTGTVLSTELPLLLTATLNLTNSQILSLNTVPIVIITAPGANKLIVPVSFAYYGDYTAGAYSGNTVVNAIISGSTANSIGGVNGIIANTTVTRVGSVGQSDDMTPQLLTDVMNKPLLIQSGADVTGGNVANFLRIRLTYFIADLS